MSDIAKQKRAKQLANALAGIIVEAVTEACKDGGMGLPEGHLYAFLSPYLTLDQFNGIISSMVVKGYLKRGPMHLLRIP